MGKEVMPIEITNIKPKQLADNRWDKETIINTLHDEVSRLNEEVSIYQNQINVLNKELEEVKPLRKHIKQHVRYRLNRLDKIIENKIIKKKYYKPIQINNLNYSKDDIFSVINSVDKENYSMYNQPINQPMLLQFYYKLRSYILVILRKIVHILRVP